MKYLLDTDICVYWLKDEICACFGNLKALLEKQGMIIDDADLFIAACALTTGVILVTNNTKHFKRINGLQLQNWSHYANQP